MVSVMVRAGGIPGNRWQDRIFAGISGMAVTIYMVMCILKSGWTVNTMPNPICIVVGIAHELVKKAQTAHVGGRGTDSRSGGYTSRRRRTKTRI